MGYDRYKKFNSDGVVSDVPFVKIPKRDTDAYEVYRKNFTRLDLLSNKYYGDANFGWLILQANPTVPSMEFLISDGTELRIPLPLEQVLIQYENDIDNYRLLYSM